MHYSKIKWADVANGTGNRISLFVSGCNHGCPGCFNQEAWDFQNGAPYTKELQEKILHELGASYIRGLSLLGGEPLAPQNQEAVLNLLQEAKAQYPEKDIWCYTGYLYEPLANNSIGSHSLEILSLIDILVDGLFLEQEKNLKLFFRGSQNQRIIHTKTSLQKKIVFTIPDESVMKYEDFVKNRNITEIKTERQNSRKRI